MFRKVLIANRGEIAVRILRACHELGVRTVAVYSEVDRCALHVRYADEAYLIGPPADVIAAMGDKVAARRIMREAGVPIIPGTEVDLRDEEILQRAGEVGFPLFIKAAAGGGGKGMRLVRSPDELPGALGAARREAMGAFGDDRIYLEKAVRGARHVEIQVLADSHGNVIHLGERECSIQRRHQKLIEEAPSPAVNEELRQRMGEVAIRAAAAVGYVNAGTIEFLLDEDRNFYFLEMNTRLQVEHPVTELVTGVDIVKEQLRIAAGRRLRYTQEDIHLKGWAIECRITAEDPYNNFLPSSGRITALFEPTGPGVRLDSGVYEGFEVSLYYDPLIAKLIVWGHTRGEAILRMRRALQEYRIIGVQTSIPFHQRVMDVTNFIGGVYDTSFLEKHFSMIAPEHGKYNEVAAIIATLLTHERRQQALASISRRDSTDQISPWRLVGRREAMGR